MEDKASKTRWIADGLALVSMTAGLLVAFRLGEAIAGAGDRWGWSIGALAPSLPLHTAEGWTTAAVLFAWIAAYAACMYAAFIALKHRSGSGRRDLEGRPAMLFNTALIASLIAMAWSQLT